MIFCPKERLEEYMIIAHALNHRAHGEWVMPRVGAAVRGARGWGTGLGTWGLESKIRK